MKWRPIDTAPKNGRIILNCPVRGVVIGDWYDDKYSARPKPYWTNDLQKLYGVKATRADQPTHWMPLPDRPNSA